ncbi:MAG: tyrosine--tRNA ligase [Candidatus Saccharimonadales bacterium]
MTLSEELRYRGFVNQTTYKDLSALDGEPITFYFGVDPSADSMQIGNLAAAMMVRHFINYGHKAVLLVGGATGMIGDPDGKKDERNLKTLDEIARNKAAIAEQYRQVFSGQAFDIVDNYDWFKDLGYLAFLREVGKHVPMRQMLGRDFVQARLGIDGSGISYAEFSYSLIQGYDFVHLFREKGVTLQVCGADQWGNSIAGVDLIRRLEGKEAHVYSVPLIINKATGKKFGKSEDGAVWLDPAKTSAYKFYQFWLNLDDEGVEDYLKVYTLLSKEEIERIIAEWNENRGGRLAQKTLAWEVTKLVHGEETAGSVRHITGALFGDTDYASLSPSEFGLLAEELPKFQFAHDNNSIDMLYEILIATSLASSKTEARRFVEAGAVYWNGEKVTSETNLNGFIHGCAIIRRGKNQNALIVTGK